MILAADDPFLYVWWDLKLRYSPVNVCLHYTDILNVCTVRDVKTFRKARLLSSLCKEQYLGSSNEYIKRITSCFQQRNKRNRAEKMLRIYLKCWKRVVGWKIINLMQQNGDAFEVYCIDGKVNTVPFSV